jgi:hypothetical protein
MEPHGIEQSPTYADETALTPSNDPSGQLLATADPAQY